MTPKKLTAGLSWKFDYDEPEYPASDWSLTVYLRGASSIDLEATVDGERHVIHEAGAVTGEYEAGLYAYAVRVTDGEDVIEIEAGMIEISADLAAVPEGHDPRGHAQRALAAIEAVLEKRATKDQESYSIAGRSLSRTPIADLIQMREYYRKEVQRGAGKKRRLLGRKVRVFA